ncbi:MAG: hypothetical protein WBQ94_09755, partial [Terracidiphilus sp.]
HVVLQWKIRPADLANRIPVQEVVQNAHTKIESGERSPLPIFAYGAKVKLIDTIQRAINRGQLIESVEPEKLSHAAVHEIYKRTLVPQHRYLAPMLAEAVNSPELAPHPGKWLAGIPEIDLAKVVSAWLDTNCNTEYEHLYCIGLDPDSGQLTGLLRVNRGKGYSGGPCTAGSREYVAFWVDWGSGFQYVGTASVTVHDFGCLPPAGLEYNVSLPIDLRCRMQACDEFRKTIKVRAVLSWHTPPSTTDPRAPVVWGNAIESLIQISAGMETRTGNPAACLATAGAAETDEHLTDGRVIDAAIRALQGMAFGSRAGLTVVPNSTRGGSFVTDWSFTIDANNLRRKGGALTLYFWNRSNIHRGTTSYMNHQKAVYCPQETS